jgi:hypothetical protein
MPNSPKEEHDKVANEAVWTNILETAQVEKQ